MALKSFSEYELVGAPGWSSPYTSGVGLKDIIQQVRGLTVSEVDGGAAGDHTLTGITTSDHLIAVVHLEGSGSAVTGAATLTSEFSITAANTINNTGGTATTNGFLLVYWFDQSAGA